MPFTSDSPPPSRRPRRVTHDQLKHDVLMGLATGVPLSVIARRNGTSQPVVDGLKARDPAFAEEMAAARALGWDHLAVECLEIADDTTQDVVFDAEGVPHPNSASVLSRRLRIETRLKLLAKWDSGRYGDTKRVEVDANLTQTHRHVLDPRQLDDAGRAALRHLLEAAEAQGLLTAPDEAQEAEFVEVSDEAA